MRLWARSIPETPVPTMTISMGFTARLPAYTLGNVAADCRIRSQSTEVTMCSEEVIRQQIEGGAFGESLANESSASRANERVPGLSVSSALVP
jgi:hypothetical protein